MLTSILNFFKAKTEKEMINEYLSDSISIEDLENRIRMIDRGEAPWQIHTRTLSQGWS